MACTAEQLTAVMDQFVGGSQKRYRHPANADFFISAGVHASVEITQAYWLLDLAAEHFAPLFALAWLEGEASVGVVRIEASPTERGTRALVRLVLADNSPVAAVDDVPNTDFPVGCWQFYLGTDEAGPDHYVTTMVLPQEY